MVSELFNNSCKRRQYYSLNVDTRAKRCSSRVPCWTGMYFGSSLLLKMDVYDTITRTRRLRMSPSHSSVEYILRNVSLSERREGERREKEVIACCNQWWLLCCFGRKVRGQRRTCMSPGSCMHVLCACARTADPWLAPWAARVVTSAARTGVTRTQRQQVLFGDRW